MTLQSLKCLIEIWERITYERDTIFTESRAERFNAFIKLMVEVSQFVAKYFDQGFEMGCWDDEINLLFDRYSRLFLWLSKCCSSFGDYVYIIHKSFWEVAQSIMNSDEGLRTNLRQKLLLAATNMSATVKCFDFSWEEVSDFVASIDCKIDNDDLTDSEKESIKKIQDSIYFH